MENYIGKSKVWRRVSRRKRNSVDRTKRIMKIGVAGVGHTKFGKLEHDIGGLMVEAVNEALYDGDCKNIDAIYISNFSSSFTGQCHLPAVLAGKFSGSKEITRVESACASGGLALKQASIAIQSGLYDNVLVVGVERMTDTTIEDTTSILASAASQEEIKHGCTFPSLYALMARAHMNEYGTTEEHLAKIAVKNHKNAMTNPLAQYHKEISVEDVMNSKVIASPLKLLDCAPVSDGAAAVLLTKAEADVNLIGIGHDTDSINFFERKNLASMPAVGRASKKAYKMADYSPGRIDVAEVHDCFTIAELIQIAELGFCGDEESGVVMEAGFTEVNSWYPINPSGGLKAKGHPVGATGVSQVVEIVNQLRGKASNQVKYASVGLCCNVGGSGSSAVVSIFEAK